MTPRAWRGAILVVAVLIGARAWIAARAAREIEVEVAALDAAMAGLRRALAEAPQPAARPPISATAAASPGVAAIQAPIARPSPSTGASDAPRPATIESPPVREYFPVLEEEQPVLPEVHGLVAVGGVYRLLISFPHGELHWLEEGDESAGWTVVHLAQSDAVLVRAQPLASLHWTW